jgi:tRNA modification GTPase
LREGGDVIEREGMRRARDELAHADLAIVVLDASDVEAGRNAVTDAIAGVPRQLWIHNKSDLLPAAAPFDTGERLHVSARTGAGLEALHARLRVLAQGEAGEGAFTARARHVDALRQAQSELALAREQLDHDALDLAAESLRHAHDALGEITGHVRADDLLGHIFSSFCIGK